MASFNVQDFIDRQPLRSPHYAMLAICGLAMFIDGLDVFMVGKIAPAIARGMGAHPADMQIVKVTEANLTYVAIDREGKPRQIPR
jgi:AAHS family 4-hydroxybenzoate transporter-like MFS transporter